MRKIYPILSLILLLICFTQCAEEELLTDSDLISDIQLSSAKTLDDKVPDITKVTASGSKVTIEFTNYAAPSRPEGGFELLVNGKRTYTNITPRLYSTGKNLKMTFSTNSPNSTYQIYARWNSGYVKSNEMKPGGGNDSSPSQPTDDDDDDSGSGSGDVYRPSNAKQAVISKLSFNGSKVTIDFVNFSAPSQPEGGFELMIDGKRTGTSIIPRLRSNQKNLKITFSYANPKEHCYQIYARWNSGYLSSEAVCKEGGQSTGSGAPASDEDDDDSKDDDSSDDEGSYSNVPSMKVLNAWNFNKSQPTSEGGVKFWGKDNCRIENVSSAVDNKAARFFMNTHNSSAYRTELVVTDDIPSAMAQYFSDSRGLAYAKMGNEVIYQFRVKLSDKWEKDSRYHSGDGYTSIFEFKQDYFSSREKPDRIRDATFRVRVSKNKYNFIFRATNEPFSKAPRNSEGSIVQDGRVQMKSVDASQDFGKWVQWTLHIKWSPNNDGFIRVYNNNDLVYRRENTYTAYDDASWLGPYFKFGLHDPWVKYGHDTGSSYKEVFFDHLRIGIPK